MVERANELVLKIEANESSPTVSRDFPLLELVLDRGETLLAVDLRSLGDLVDERDYSP